jgi:hypothetical protein
MNDIFAEIGDPNVSKYIYENVLGILLGEKINISKSKINADGTIDLKYIFEITIEKSFEKYKKEQNVDYLTFINQDTLNVIVYKTYKDILKAKSQSIRAVLILSGMYPGIFTAFRK